MATFTRRTVKLVAALSSVPALGATLGLSFNKVQAEENQSPPKSRIVRACDLPIYDSPNDTKSDSEPVGEIYPRNAVEEQIGVVRSFVWEYVSSGKTEFESTFNQIQEKVNTGVEHTKSTIDFVQNNPGDLPRYAFIAVAGMGGVVLGYRGSIMRKVLYSSIAMVSSAALCYPETAMELSYAVTDEVKAIWIDIGGKALVDDYWPFGEKQSKKLDIDNLPAPTVTSNTEVKGDPGQSNPNDKDMYSTRS